MAQFLLKNFRFQIILFVFTCLFLACQQTNAQEDTMFVHVSSGVDFYPTSEVDSVTFHYGTTHITDSMIIWNNNFLIAKYLVNNVDSISFSYSPTIYQPLIAYCEGIPMVHDLRDLSVYRTVQIGNQCWLRENLRYLPAVYSPNGISYSELRYHVYDYYGDSLSGALNNQNYIRYGALYNYPAAKSACPKGWKLPTNEEWDSLENYLITHHFNYDESMIGNKIAKSLTGSTSQSNGGYWQNSNDAGTPGSTDFEWKRNLSGFSILPGGLLALTGFLNINMESYFWGSSNSINSSENSRSIYFNYYGLNNDLMPKQNGLSVRCIAKPLLVQTDSVTNLSNHYATLMGSLEVGAVPIIEKGFYIKKLSQSNWTKYIVNDNHFSLLLTNLDSLSTYHFFAFATNLAETKYGDTLEFTTYSYPICPGHPIFIDQRDNELYNTVKIGNQCWLKENLRYLPSISNLSSSTTVANYYVYGYNGSNIQEAKLTNQYSTFGVLYNRVACLNGGSNSNTNPSCIKGICPSGWHLPSESEFIELINTLGGSSVAGAKMKSITMWNNNGYGNNSSYFTALPSGKMNGSSFINSGDGAFYWCSSKNTSDETALSFFINSTSSGVFSIFYNQTNGLSVRCIKNELYLNIDSISELTAQSVKIYSTITPGYDSVISRGIYWKSINENQWHIVPTLGLNFNITLSGLAPHTTYQILCFNLDISGLKLSDTTYFTTLHTLPIPKIPSITKQYYNKVILKFENTPGTLPITAQWYRYKCIDSSNWNIISYNGLIFNDTIQSLVPGNVYDITNVIVSQTDTLYSTNLRLATPLHIPCPGYELVMDPRDSNYYETVLINGTCWMKENLRYLPSVVTPSTYSSNIPYYFVYGYNGSDLNIAKNMSSYKTYGTLYNFNAATNGGSSWDQRPSLLQGVCPDGWYLPSRPEWESLFIYLRNDGRFHIPNLSNDNINKSLTASTAQTNGGLWANSTVEGTPGTTDFPDKRNLSGMSIIPGGCIANLQFLGIGEGAFYWTSGRYYNVGTYYITDINYNLGTATAYNRLFSSKYAASVRCVKHTKPIPFVSNGSNIGLNSFTMNGYILRGIDTVISKGFLWKPILDTIWNSVFLSSDTFSYNINNIDSASIFEYKAFAITSTDSIYSNTTKVYTKGSKPCPNIPTVLDLRDSSVYNTVKIGEQCWLKENLRYLPKVTSNSTTSSNDTLFYVYGYNDTIVSNAKQTTNYLRYGVLYNRINMLKNICPPGWEMPNISHWDTLKSFLINQGYNYNSLTSSNKIAKSLSGSEPYSNGGYWTNSNVEGAPGNTDYSNYRNKTQLTFIPGGYISNGTTYGIDSVAKFWIYEGAYNFYYPKAASINFNSDSLKFENSSNYDANYVRCVQTIPENFEIDIISIDTNFIKINFRSSYVTANTNNKTIQYKIEDSLTWNEIGLFSSNISLYNLIPNTKYIIRGFNYFGVDTIWTSTRIARTLPSRPNFSSISIDNITPYSATPRLIVSKTSLPILSRGIQYQIHNSNIWTTIQLNSDTIEIQLNNLLMGTYYRVRAFATDSVTTYYSSYVTFSTSINGPCPNNQTLIDSRDGNTYNTVQIGNQCWMRENLRYLPDVSAPSSSSTTAPFYYVQGYNNNIVSEAIATPNFQKYGTLYNWNAATNGAYNSTTIPPIIEGICPTGWHLPKRAEFDTLIQYLSANQYSNNSSYSNYIANSMMSSYSLYYYGGLWQYQHSYGIIPSSFEVLNKKNISGFSAKPGGYVNSGQFVNLSVEGLFWTADPYTSNYSHAYMFQIYYANPYVSILNYQTNNGASVRCVKN